MKSFHVRAPTRILFVCGGKTDASAPFPLSLRDAFVRLHYDQTAPEYSLLLAEELNAFFPKGTYRDILSFENDIAQIAELIVLFSESYGSVAELGAFSVTRGIADRLLVIIDDENYEKDSFITLGPLLALQNIYGEEAICVLFRNDINIESIRNIKNLDMSILSLRIQAALKVRIAKAKRRSTFDSGISGHCVKFIVGLVQHYGSLTAPEILVLIEQFGWTRSLAEIQNFLLCAEFARWVRKEKRGVNTFYAAVSSQSAIEYHSLSSKTRIDRKRWHTDIIEYWRQNEPERFNSIRAARAMTNE